MLRGEGGVHPYGGLFYIAGLRYYSKEKLVHGFIAGLFSFGLNRYCVLRKITGGFHGQNSICGERCST